MAAHGGDPGPLGSAEAGQWLRVWGQEHAAGRRAALPRRLVGPGVAPDPLGQPVLTGRRLFKG
eukprot:12515936-Alexandrium_andersonii.AAC.1